MQGPTIWLGRGRRGAEVLWFRATTSGEAPGPSDEVEAIDDPFVGDEDPVAAISKAPALGAAFALSELELEVPAEPSKIIGVGRNYRAHAEELGNEVPESPLLFFKPPSCLLPSAAAIELPAGYERIDMEAELVVVIGARAREVRAADAWNHVLGYTLGNDVSCRDLQKRDKQWTRAKGFDGFGPCGPFVRVTPPGEALEADAVTIEGWLDDQKIQEGRCSAMIFDIPSLVEHISACMTLEPGDLIYTGTPAGVSALSPGMVCRVQTGGMALGRLTNPVVGPVVARASST